MDEPLPETPSGGPPGPLPGTLRAAVLLLAAEAVALGGLAVFLAYEDVTATATSLSGALFVTACTAGAAAVLATIARSLYRRRAGGRGLAIVLQLMLLPVGYYMVKGGLPWLGVPAIALGLLVSALLVAPPTVEALDLRHRGDTP